MLLSVIRLDPLCIHDLPIFNLTHQIVKYLRTFQRGIVEHIRHIKPFGSNITLLTDSVYTADTNGFEPSVNRIDTHRSYGHHTENIYDRQYEAPPIGYILYHFS